jgi:hypothetical protein
MRTNTAVLLTGVLLAVAFATGCAANAEGGTQASRDGGEDQTRLGDQARPADQAQLEIEGDSGTEFSGSCAVGDGEPQDIGGQTPASFTYDLGGNALECEIASEGNVQVDLAAGNSHSVQRISGGTLNLTYDNGSISSVASSSSGSSSSVSSQVVSSGESGGEPEDATNGSDDVTSESRDVSGFDEVELSGVGNLSIRQTGSESLTVEAEEDVLADIRTEVVNDRLVIGPEPNTVLHTTGPINYELTVKDLRALRLAGSGNVEAEGISTDELAVTISGAGTVKISGRTDSQDVDIAGVGSYRAGDLESEEAKVAVVGAGSAVVNASEVLEAKISGAGSVEYIGDPTVHQEVSGVGRVSKR